MPPENTDTTNSNQNSGFGIRNVERTERTGVAEKASSVTQKTGTAIQAGGIAMQAAGTGAKVAGAGLTAAGAGLSATGVGAVVGAPMMAVGRVLGAGGTAAKAGGKAVSGVGRSIRHTGSSARLASGGTLGKIKTIVRLPLDLTSFLFVSWLGTLWLMQFFAAIMSIFMLGVGGGVAALNNVELWGLFGGVSLQDLIDMIKFVFGVNVNLADHFGSLYMFFSFLALMMGFFSLILVAFRSILRLESPFWGNGAAIKIAAFLMAIVGYTIPLANLFPWVFLYSLTLMMQQD